MELDPQILNDFMAYAHTKKAEDLPAPNFPGYAATLSPQPAPGLAPIVARPGAVSAPVSAPGVTGTPSGLVGAPIVSSQPAARQGNFTSSGPTAPAPAKAAPIRL